VKEVKDPRPAHHGFKWLVIQAALSDGPAFAKTYAGSNGAAKLAALWTQANAKVPAAERIPNDGLALEVHGDPASPVMFVTLPPPAANNEAFMLAFIPTDNVPVHFRVFALEKGVFPKTGAAMVYLIETTRTQRHNFGPPSNDAPDDTDRGGFVSAILEICDGKRKPLSTTAIGA
jgi:hypothetical protein